MEEAINQTQQLIHCSDGTLADPSLGCVPTPEALVNGATTLSDLFYQIAAGLTSSLAIVATFACIYGALHYLTSRGNQDQMDKAKRILFWSIFGLVLGLMGRFVLSAIGGIVSV